MSVAGFSLPSVAGAPAANVMLGPGRFPSADLNGVLDRKEAIRQTSVLHVHHREPRPGDGTPVSAPRGANYLTQGRFFSPNLLQRDGFRDRPFPGCNRNRENRHAGTGCRRGEIVQLRWSEVRDDVLVLSDSKTGPRKVLLNTQARCILERQPRNGSPFVIPSPLAPSRPRGGNLSLRPAWRRNRRCTNIQAGPAAGGGSMLPGTSPARHDGLTALTPCRLERIEPGHRLGRLGPIVKAASVRRSARGMVRRIGYSGFPISASRISSAMRAGR